MFNDTELPFWEKFMKSLETHPQILKECDREQFPLMLIKIQEDIL